MRVQTYKASGGERIEVVSRKMAAIANITGDSVETEFNGIRLTARIGDNTNDIEEEYFRKSRERERVEETAKLREREEETEAIKDPYREAIRRANYLIGQGRALRSLELYEKWLSLPVVADALKKD